MTATLTEALDGALERVTGAGTTVGCDVVDVARFAAVLERRDGFAERVFTSNEIAAARRGGAAAGSPVFRRRLAARFAAKEAVRKARGDLRMPFHAVEVRTAADGAPQLYEHGLPSPLRLSLSHDGDVAIAVVVGEHDDTRDVLGLTEPPAPPDWASLPGMPALTDML